MRKFTRVARFTSAIFIFIFLREKTDRLAPKYKRQLTTRQVFRQVERRFHSWNSRRQPLS
jgi:hypothetical protein